MRNLSSTSFKHACKLCLILLICASFVLQTNITKALAETLYAPDSPSSLVGTPEEIDDSLVTPDDPDQEMPPDVPETASEDVSHSMNSESNLSAETFQSNALGSPFAWDPTTNVLTIQGDCKASDIASEIRNEASSAREACFSGAVTITTDQDTLSPFSGATNLARITALDGAHVSFAASAGTVNPTLKNFFRSCTNLVSIGGLASWDVSNVSGDSCMDCTFYNCINLASLDGLASWDVSNANGASCMFQMFRDCTSLTSLDGLASWDVSNVAGSDCMSTMFRGCESLTSLEGLSSWNVSNVAGKLCMHYMFSGCTDLQDITDIASWNLAKAKAADSGVTGMFRDCTNITYIKGASTDAAGFVPQNAMDIPTLVSSNSFYSEQAPTTPVSGWLLLGDWPTYAPQGTWTWKQTVTFDANGGMGTPSPELVVHNAYATQPTPEQNPTRAGYYFTGWTTDAAGSAPFDFQHTKIGSDTILYAQWSPLPVYTVVFNTTGGSLEETQYIVQGNTATRPAEDPTRAGYTFVNWYADETGATLFDFDTPIFADTVVYAHWSVSPSPSDDAPISTNDLLPQTGDVSSVLLPLLFLPAAVVFFTGYVVLKRNER